MTEALGTDLLQTVVELEAGARVRIDLDGQALRFSAGRCFGDEHVRKIWASTFTHACPVLILYPKKDNPTGEKP